MEDKLHGKCSIHGAVKLQHKTVVRKSEGKRLLQKSMHRREDNGELGVDWIHVTHYTGLVASTCEWNIEPLRSMKNLECFYQLLFLSFWSF